jgi:hypothetical protein
MVTIAALGRRSLRIRFEVFSTFLADHHGVTTFVRTWFERGQRPTNFARQCDPGGRSSVILEQEFI